jgi:hypothetical protein
MIIRLVNVTSVTPLGAFKLRVSFSDGASGDHDFAPIIAAGGQMVEPLRDREVFQKAFVMMGTLCWPNGFDLDAIQLHREMSDAGEFLVQAAE